MNWFDIVIVLLLLCAAWEGWKQGAVIQVMGLGAVALGIWGAWKFGHQTGVWLGMEGLAATVAGFAVVLVGVVVVVTLVGHLARGLFKLVGLGVFDNLLGTLFSMLRTFIIAALLVMVVEAADPGGKVLTDRTKGRSVMYGAMEAVNGVVFPFVGKLFK